MITDNDNNYPIRLASEYGHIDIVKLLLADKRVDPSYFYNLALLSACEKGYIKIVKLLLSDTRVEANCNMNDPIFYAFKNNKDEIVNFLWSFQCVKSTLENEHLNIYNNLIKRDITKKIKLLKKKSVSIFL